jgi:hypothetical protein
VAVYCDPFIGPREWQDTETWHTPDREKIDRITLAETLSRHRTVPVASFEEQFKNLLIEWRESTENMSSVTRILSHPAYQRIIDLGRQHNGLITMILEDFKHNGGYWSTALQAITGQNAVTPKHIGNPGKVREDWLTWGRQHGYL